ncbi:hypothetical protein LUZ60_001828 [Juncus effusus]|nr:hypothetical protein LUZ60_001828 [Juncus effusus]
MFPSPLKFIRLLSPSKSKQMKRDSKEITNASIYSTNPNSNTTFYLCITSKGKLQYLHNKNGRELEYLASLCLEQTPLYHKWYFHTVGTKSFGFLTEQNFTIFAIVDPTLGNIELQDFLNRVKQIFITVPKKSLQKELAPIVSNFLTSIEKNSKNEGNIVYNDILIEAEFEERERRERKARNEKKREIQIDEEIDENNVEEVEIERRNGESSEMIGRERKSKKAVFWRHVKIVFIVDFVVCLVLFAVWLGVCQGFNCILLDIESNLGIKLLIHPQKIKIKNVEMGCECGFYRGMKNLDED